MYSWGPQGQICMAFTGPSQVLGMMNTDNKRRFNNESALCMDLGVGDGRNRLDRGTGRVSRRPDGPNRHDDGRGRQGFLPGLLRLRVWLPVLRSVLSLPDRVLPVPLHLLAPVGPWRIWRRLLASAPARPGDAGHARFAAGWNA